MTLKSSILTRSLQPEDKKNDNVFHLPNHFKTHVCLDIYKTQGFLTVHKCIFSFSAVMLLVVSVLFGEYCVS